MVQEFYVTDPVSGKRAPRGCNLTVPAADAGEAARRNLSVEEYAAKVADQWRAGLAEWDQTPERIARHIEGPQLVRPARAHRQHRELQRIARRRRDQRFECGIDQRFVARG